MSSAFELTAARTPTKEERHFALLDGVAFSNRRLGRNRFQVRTQSDPCISSVATAIMITTSDSSVKKNVGTDGECGDENVGTDGTFTSFSFGSVARKKSGYVPSVPTFPIAGQITGPDVITVQPETLGSLARGRK